MLSKKKLLKWDYSKAAKNYDLRADYSEKLFKKIIKKTSSSKNSLVVDIGAGTGKLTKLLCKNKFKVIAIEPNKSMRFYGKKNLKKYLNIKWKDAKAENTKLKSNIAQCVFFGSSFNVVNHKKTFKEIKRILRNKGFFCFMWNHRNLNNIHQKKIENIVKKNLPNYKYGERRSDYRKILQKEKNFTNIEKLSQKFSVKIKNKNFLKAWRSHETLRKNCKNDREFEKIINEIAAYVNSRLKNYIKVTYDNVAYIGQLK